MIILYRFLYHLSTYIDMLFQNTLRNIHSFKLLLLFFLPGYAVSLSAQVSPFIHVDQFGYPTDADKVAILSDPQIGFNSNLSYTPPADIELRATSSGNLIATLTPQVWNSGNTHSQSGDKGWWVDFSFLTTPGVYYLYDATNNERSADFDINDEVYQGVLKAAMRMFYYNRSNIEKVAPYAENNWTDASSFMNALQDTECRFIEQPGNAALEKDLSGGWFDAGDYNKYVTFTVETLHDLLWAFQESPAVFTDDYNIPESGNGLPDLLDELKWEFDWLLKMNNADGSTHIKMGSINFLNAASPPSQNFDQRYYGPTCSSASITVAGLFAHAAYVMKDFSALASYANTLEQRAISSWNYVLPLINANNLDENCDDGTINAGDADMNAETQKEHALVAAVHLFQLTGQSSYRDYVENHYDEMAPLVSGFWGVNNLPLVEVLLLYADLPEASSSASSAIRNSFQTAVSNNWNDFFGFSNNDLYRAAMPDWSYHWGSNNPKATYANLNLLINKYGYDQGNTQTYRSAALEKLHYFHGVNPLGTVYLSNMYNLGAERCVNQIYHGWFADGTDYDDAQNSLYGPPPGYVVGGPNADFTISSISPPSGQPQQKSYLDFNDDWPMNSWEISEPAIYYQASFVRLAAAFTQANTPLSVSWQQPLSGYISGQENHLRWFTAEEIDNAYFELERSAKGQNWQSIRKVPSAANGQQGAAYRVIDHTPLKGTNYYRLRQVDLDGSFSYSNTIVLQNRDRSVISFYPNPGRQVLNIQSNIRNGLLRIVNMNGQQQAEYLIEESSFQININPLPEGIYYLEVIDETNNSLFHDKFMKIK